MKKIIVLGFAIVTAVAANAAQFAWAALAIQKVDGASSVGANAYLVDSSVVSRDAMIAALAGGDFSQLEADGAVLLTTKTVAQGTTGISRINLTGGTPTAETYSAYTIVLNGDIGSASHFLVTKELTNVSNPGYGGGLGDVQMSFGTQAAVAWTAVPEPTSGLLMLVGLAGLALRRRRA